jgi:acetyl-CoA acyltransferase
MTGWRTVLNYGIASTTPDYYSSMGLTAEAVAQQFKVSRLDQDTFSYESHVKAIKAIESGKFASEIVPVTVEEIYLDANGKRKTRSNIVSVDEGARKDTTVEGLGALKPVFAARGSVTAGNSSQTSDGAAFALIMSEKMVKELNIEPLARLVSCTTVGVEPRIMGIGPVAAIPKALKMAGLKQDDIDLIELNEAFAAQSLAVIRELGLDTSKINVNGGAIALGHPLGCSGAKLSVQLLNEMKRQNKKYGMVSACIGGGQGIAGIYELLK